MAEGGPGKRRGGSVGRGAVLFVLSRRARRRPRAVPGGRHLPRPRRRPGEPWAPVALLPRPPHVLVVRGPEVERGAGARAGDRWCGDGVGPAPSAVERPARGSEPSRESRGFWARYLTCYVAIAAAIFSAIPYKTPWNLLPFYVGAIVLAGIGFSALVHATASRAVRGALAAALVIASGQLGWQAWRASVTYASDPRNPYVYAQTVPDAVRMATRIRELAALHPDGARMQVSVIAPPHEQWPLPWYLRTMPTRRLLDRTGRPAGAAGAGHRCRRRITQTSSIAPSAIATCRSSSVSGPRCSWRSTSSAGCGSASWPVSRLAGDTRRAETRADILAFEKAPRAAAAGHPSS